MRITWGMMLNNMLAGMNLSSASIIKYQTQLATGKRINKPSDDPTGVVRVLSLRTALNQTETYLNNISQAHEWLAVSETAISRTHEVIARGIELAQMGANVVLPQASRDAIAAEVDELIDTVVTAGNTRYGDRYVFAGTRTRDVPFALTGSPPTGYSYGGNAAAIAWETEPGVSQRVNTDGEPAFGPAIDALIDLRDHLRAGDTAALGSIDITQLQGIHDSLLQAQTDIGAKVRRLDETKESLTQLKHTVYELLEKYEGADMAEAIMRLQMAEASYSAAQSATARIIQPTLVDLIR